MTIEERVAKIEQRNLKVQAEKAWETSAFRVLTIMILTYVVVVLFFIQTGNPEPFLSALIPALGFFLSTQSLPFLKRWWIKKYLSH